ARRALSGRDGKWCTKSDDSDRESTSVLRGIGRCRGAPRSRVLRRRTDGGEQGAGNQLATSAKLVFTRVKSVLICLSMRLTQASRAESQLHRICPHQFHVDI